jgi:hypothetical protein
MRNMATQERRIDVQQIEEALRQILPPGERVTEDALEEAAENVKTVVAKAIDFGDADHELGKSKQP